MYYIKVNALRVLRGTMAGEPLEFQAIWFRLLCLANEAGYRDGKLMFPPDKPMTREYIATAISVDLEVFNKAVEYFQNEVNEDPDSEHYGTARLQELDGGMFYIANFCDYQLMGKQKSQATKQDIPLAPEDKEASQQAAAARLAYLQPDAAKRGIGAKEAEEGIKEATKRIKEIPVGGA